MRVSRNRRFGTPDMANNLTLQFQADRLSSKVRGLVNAELKEICRKERLAVSGIKAVLQRRIVDRNATTQI